MATASALTNWFSQPGVLMSENYPDVLDSRFKTITRGVWEQPIQGLSRGYWDEQTTSKAYEKYSQMGGTGVVPKSRDVDNLPVLHLVPSWDITITPETFRAEMVIEERLRETDQFRVIDRVMEDLNEAARDTIELYAARPYNTAFSATVDWVCGDGMLLCDKDRKYELTSEGTWDNEETAASLTQSSIASMNLNFGKVKKPNGRISPMNLKKLVIPRDLRDTAVVQLGKVAGAILKPGSSVNDGNYLMGYGIDFEVWDYLTSTTAYFGLADAKYLKDEIIWLWGSRVNVKPTRTNDPDVYAKRVRFVFGTGCRRPHGLRGNQGA
jgi:hypothetical protein